MSKTGQVVKTNLFNAEFMNIPDELKQRKQWVAYKLVYRPGDEKPTKVPIPAKRLTLKGGYASTTAPGTWTTFDKAVEYYEKYKGQCHTHHKRGEEGIVSGIGYVFSADDEFTGIDLDDCFDSFGNIAKWALDWVVRFDSYTEVSRSGNGLHIIVKGKIPEGFNVGNFEGYSSERYFVFTGLIYQSRDTINERQEVIDAYYNECSNKADITEKGQQIPSLKSPPPLKLATPPSITPQIMDDRTDELIDVVIDNIVSGAKPEKFEKLLSTLNNDHEFNGQPVIGGLYKSESERDHSVMCSLMYYTGDAMDYSDRILTVQSMLYGGLIHRPKWDERRSGSTWFQLEVLKAFNFISTGDRGFFVPYKADKEIIRHTDTGNALRFAAQHEGKALYCYPWRKWLCYDGQRWSQDSSGMIQELAKETVRSIYLEAAAEKNEDKRKATSSWAFKSESKSNRKDMLELAQSEPCFPVQPDEFDTDPWLLNVRNGTLDLETGKLMPHDQRDMITKMVPVRYDPKATAPRWGKFMKEVVDPDIATFLQRAVGYSLTGVTSEQCLFFLHGSGANGKSVFIDTICTILGSHAVQADFSTFLAKQGGGIPNDIARLKGARFVAAVECPDDQRFNEVLIKQLTGGDRIAARFLHKEFFEFTPCFKLWLAGNHRPRIKGSDYAIWRRMQIVEFSRVILPHKQDKRLKEKLATEASGILAWALRGLKDYLATGLNPPASVGEAVSDYRAMVDPMQQFITDRCTIAIGARCVRSQLYAEYVAWCDAHSTTPVLAKKFASDLQYFGVDDGGKGRVDGEFVRYWEGISINSGTPDAASGVGSATN